jgi:hypothetical protein
VADQIGRDGRPIMPTCTVCGMRKQPLGRSVGMEMANGVCSWDCPGYRQDPQPSSYFFAGEAPLPGTREAQGWEGSEFRACPPGSD